MSRYDGRYEHVFETQTAGYLIQAPQLDINTVAAGGGSMLFFRGGLFVVGPESVRIYPIFSIILLNCIFYSSLLKASSNPGPACYKKGKHLY